MKLFFLFIAIFTPIIYGKCIPTPNVMGNPNQYGCNDFERGIQCQYAQSQIDLFAERVNHYYLVLSFHIQTSFNTSIIWLNKPILKCGMDISFYCNSDPICESINEANKCFNATSALTRYVNILKDNNFTSDWIISSIPIIYCEPIYQTSGAIRKLHHPLSGLFY